MAPKLSPKDFGNDSFKVLPRSRGRLRLAPDFYFLPRRSLGATIAIYGSSIAAGIAAGMLVEQWIRKKVEDDGGYITLGKKKEGDRA
eukprot:c26410_g2_i1 orf=381-641(+)